MSKSLEEKLLAFADSFDMLPVKCRVLAAVSGGADSVSLLLALNGIAEKRQIALTAAHYNHCLRGGESDGDEKFVKDLCTRLGVPFVSGRGDVKGEAEKTGESLEEAARRLRYAFLRQAAHGAFIATAHTSDDNAETVLMNLMRGAGIKGLSGIPPVRGDIIRPMLTVTRREVEEYLREQGQTYREDSTNASDDYTRNRIRHALVPLMTEMSPEFLTMTERTTRLLREDEKCLSDMAEAFIKENFRGESLPVKELTELPAAVSSRVVRHICGGGLSLAHTRSVLELLYSPDPSAETNIPGLTVRREYDKLVFGKREETFSPEILPENGEAVLETGTRIFCEKRRFDRKINKSFNTFIFKYDDVCGTITVRPRKTGDSIAVNGCRKTLKKLFIEKKIPAVSRAAVPVITDEKRILAVAGIGQAFPGQISEGDEVLVITVGR